MGGSLICSILEEGRQQKKLLTTERLILQPNVGEHLVRKWLDQNGFEIRQEEILKEHGKFYEIIVAEKNAEKKVQNYSESDYQFGPVLRKECSSFFIEKWQKELDKNQTILEKLRLSAHDTT